MSNMLQFKMGQFAGLANQGIAPGTVYVTTDEKALYVDIPANGEQAAKRIRMGDVIQVQDVAELTSFAPDYSTTALYYVIDKNALMKYTGDGTTHSWKQINSVSDVTTNLNNLTQRVTTAEGKITGLETTLGANDVAGSTAFGRIKDLEDKMGTAEDEIDALQTLTDEQKTAIENLQEAVGDGAEGLASKVTGLEGRMDTVEGGITAINGKIGTVESGKTVVGLIGEAVTTAAGDATAKANKALEDAQAYADQAELDAIAAANSYTDTAIGGVNATIGGVNDKIGTVGDTADKETVYGAIAAAKAHAETKATEAKDAAVAAAATDATNKASQALADAKDYTDDEIAKVNATIGTVDSGKTVTGMIAEAKTAAADALTDAKDYADGAKDAAIEAAAADATTKAGTAESNAKAYADDEIAKVNAVIGKKGAGEEASTGLYAEIETAASSALADAKDYTDNMLQAADAMTFKGVLGGEGANVTSLPEAADVQAGDTYKIGAEGTYAGHVAKVGDLLIAVEDGKAEYVLVSSGYEDDYDARLGVDATNGKVILRDAMKHANGSVQFVGDGDNGSVKVEVTGTEDPTTGQADSKVTISLQWGTF